MLGHHSRPPQLRGGCRREQARQLSDHLPFHLLAPESSKSAGGTDDYLQILPAGFRLPSIENPLPDAVDEHDVRLGQYRSIEPQVDAGNRRMFQTAKVAKVRVPIL